MWPIKVDTTWQAQLGKGFEVTCFTIDRDQEIVTYPNGRVSRVWDDSQDKAAHPASTFGLYMKDRLVRPVRTF